MCQPTKNKVVLTCQRKRRYPDELTAVSAGQYSMEQAADGVPLFVYRCTVCLGYHLTGRHLPNQIQVVSCERT